MADRTRSNPQWDKIPTKLGPKNSSDRQKDIKFLITSIKQNDEKIREEKSSKMPNEKRIAKCQEIIDSCKQTIRREALAMASAHMILTAIMKEIDKGDYDAALKKSMEIKDVAVDTFFTAALAKKQRG